MIATRLIAYAFNLTVCGEMRINMDIEIGSVLKTETAYDKDMTITHDGKDYRVILHWNWEHGFEATWLDDEGRFVLQPDWVDQVGNEFYLKLDRVKEHSKASI
jgi:hypothetical protein